MPGPKVSNLYPIGVLGLGLMGQGITACLLANGCKVVAYNRPEPRAASAPRRIGATLRDFACRVPSQQRHIAGWQGRLTVTNSLDDIKDCGFIIETVIENLTIKRRLYDKLETIVSPRAIIASNTSSFPVDILQQGRRHPERFIVMHWAEPAWITRYLEIVPGKKTSRAARAAAEAVGLACRKESSLLNHDIRGFISNRLMYALMREACHLVESGVADVATVDKSFRNDIGWWSTLAGPFRWMDLTGIPAYATVMEGLFPELSSNRKLPKMMRDIVRSGAKGIANHKGFYPYTPATAKRWEKAWVGFTWDLKRLVDKYEKQV